MKNGAVREGSREVGEQRKEGRIRGREKKEKETVTGGGEECVCVRACVCAQDSYSPPSAVLRFSAAVELRPGKETKRKRR